MKKMMNCKSCGKEISKGVKCPNCGKDNRNFFMKHKIISSILGLVIIGSMGGCVNNDTPTKVESAATQESAEKTETTSTKQQEERNFKVGDTAEKEGQYRITVNKLYEYVSNNEFIIASEGKKYVVADITVENLGETEDISVSSMVCFNLLGLDGKKYDMTIADVDGQLDGSVAPGRKLNGTVTYEVPVDVTEAELEVNLDVFTGKTIFFKGTIE